jgi:hypothetical protein
LRRKVIATTGDLLVDQDAKRYFERRAKEEAIKANEAPKSDAATVHRELEKLYRDKVAGDANELGIVEE